MRGQTDGMLLLLILACEMDGWCVFKELNRLAIFVGNVPSVVKIV